jgi:pyruvate kinase
VAEASKNLSAACIIVLSETGLTAMNISKFRPRIPIVTIVPNAKAGRLLQVGGESVSSFIIAFGQVFTDVLRGSDRMNRRVVKPVSPLLSLHSRWSCF